MFHKSFINIFSYFHTFKNTNSLFRQNCFEIPGISKALVSVETFCDHGCQAVLDDKKVIIINKGNGKILMKFRQDPLSNLYLLNLTQCNNLMTEFQTPDECFAGNVYELKSKDTPVDYHHASCWSPTQYG